MTLKTCQLILAGLCLAGALVSTVVIASTLMAPEEAVVEHVATAHLKCDRVSIDTHDEVLKRTGDVDRAAVKAGRAYDLCVSNA